MSQSQYEEQAPTRKETDCQAGDRAWAGGDRARGRNLRLTPWALEPFIVGVLSAAAAIRKPPHTILTLVSQRFEPGGRCFSVRLHTVRRPGLALGDGAATRVGLSTLQHIVLQRNLYYSVIRRILHENLIGALDQILM